MNRWLRGLALIFSLILGCSSAKAQNANFGPECQKNLRLNGNGTMTLVPLGLEFQVCRVGAVYNSKDGYCRGGEGITSRDAIARYSSDSWRLMTPEEGRKALPYIGECIPLESWTSVPNVGFTNRGGSTVFVRHGVAEYPDGEKRWVHLVRAIQSSNSSAASGNANSGQTNSSANNQFPPTYKPGTSILDRYLTAPKEDCDAIPQSYNVSDRQQAVIHCRLRNANRDKYAANSNSNAASAQSVTNLQSAQQQAQHAQQLAQQNQVRADQARQGKRKTHDPAAEAHQCISIDNAGSGNFGAFKNTCGYRVNFYTCNYKPRITQGGFNWSADFDCEKQQIGMHTPGAGVSVASHNRNTEMVYWFACKAPASPVDVTYVQGQGLSGRCN